MSENKSDSASESKAKELKISFKLKKVAVHAQTYLFTLGVALPLALVWLGTYVMFTLPALLTQIETFLKNFTPEQAPALYANFLIPLNANSSLAYYVIGIVLYVFALVLARKVAMRLKIANLTIGEVRLRSLIITVLIAFIVAGVLVSLANRAMFDPLLALQGA